MRQRECSPNLVFTRITHVEEKNASGQDTKLAMRLAEAAKLLSLSERCLWGLANEGVIPSFKAGSARLFSRRSIEEWISKKEEEAN